jgi:hypothetical protein
MKKLLQFSYTPLTGKNGGSQRAMRIAKLLGESFDVRTISFDVQPNVKTEFLNSVFYVNREEYHAFGKGQYEFETIFIMHNKMFLENLLNAVAEYKDDIILVSGANFYPLIKYVIDSGLFTGKLIYDSHGKADNNNYKWLEAENFFRFNADCILSTNKLDHDVLGNKSKIFKSGSVLFNYTPNIEWEQRLNRLGTNYVFVGSDNDINFASINKFIPLVPQNINLLLVGSICNRVTNLPNNIIKLGFLPEEDLIAAIQYVDGIVMPITINDGGVNVKTAEAIVSKKAAIGTREAFSGFEDFTSLPGVFCFNDLESVVEEMKRPHEKFYNREVKELLWEETFNGLLQHVEESINV